jgi:hypothetical protein
MKPKPFWMFSMMGLEPAGALATVTGWRRFVVVFISFCFFDGFNCLINLSHRSSGDVMRLADVWLFMK